MVRHALEKEKFMKKLFLLCLFLLSQTILTYSQTTPVPEDKTGFAAEMKSRFLSFDRARGKLYADRIDSLMKAGALNDDVTKLASEYINQMAAKRYRVFPHFSSYLDVVFGLINSNQLSQYPNWNESAKKVLQSKSQSVLSSFFQNSYLFFNHNIIYQSHAVIWKIRPGTVRYVYEEGKEPYVICNNIDLICYSRGDSSVIKKTEGIWNMFDETWTGKNGKLTWERTGLPASAVYAEFKNYKLALKSAEYKADSVQFTHVGFFNGSIEGVLEEKLLANVTEERVLYPRFSSYEKRVKLDKLADGIRYEGGFNIRGNRFIGIGDIQNPAYIFIDRNDKPFVSMAAMGWMFRENQIVSDKAETIIYLHREEGRDSIFHPGCQVKYFTDRKELNLSRTGEGVQRSKFSSSFHNLDFNPDMLFWKVKEDKIIFTQSRGTSSDSAVFFSDNYFRQRLYDKLGGFSQPDPLHLIKTYCDKYQTTSFTVQEMAKWFKDDVDDIRLILTRLSIEGFVNYNPDNEKAEVKKRFLNFIGARYGRNDYDVIEIGSSGIDPYGFMSLIDYRMELFGVNRIPLSDSQRVVIYPEFQQVTVEENLDMRFNGGVVGGQFTFLGKKYEFDYTLFKIKMPTVDTILVRVRRLLPDEYGEYPPIILKTPIEKVSGFLEIDHPDGKSGLKAIGAYPIFTSSKPSYTYYSQREVEGGVYPRSEFYFQIDPYVLDSLDKFNPRRLKLPGTFTSAGIFPDIREELQVMPDYSLGFHGETGSAGLPAYGGPAKFFKELTLSNQGLRGKGELAYLNSKTLGQDYRFYPDSMNAWADGYRIEANSKTPDVQGDSVYIHWEPKAGTYNVRNLGKPFSMYKGKVKLSGSVELQSNGLLAGGGIADIGSGIVMAKKFMFSPQKFNSDSADFKLRNLEANEIDTNGIAFSTSNMKTEINFEEQKGKFIANDANAFADFPVNEFRAFSERVDWHMKSNNVELKTRPGNEEGFKMLSTKYECDSLSFMAQSALFKTGEKRIENSGVVYIDVADSRVLTKDGKVNILRRSDLEPLSGAQIQMPTQVQHHLISNAEVDILGKYSIAGKGEYEYVDKTGRKQIIKMHEIKVDKDRQMTAMGTLEPEDSLKLMPHVLFKGEFHLYAQNPEPEINGFVTMDHDCPLFSKKWMRTRGFIGDGDISIPIPEDAKDDTQTPMFNGFAFASDSSGIYPVLMAGKKNYADYEVLSIHGFLKFDESNGEYKIASKEKLENAELIENYVAYNPNTCTAHGEGPLQLTGKLGQVAVHSAGEIVWNPKDTITEVNGIMGVQFNMPAELWKYLTDRYKNYNAEGPDYKESSTLKAMQYLLPVSERAKFLEKVDEDRLDKLPGVLGSSFLFTDLNLVWNKKKRSLMYAGSAGLLGMNGLYFDGAVQVHMEVLRKRSAEGLQFILEFDDGMSYYFSYRNNIMQVYSTDTDFTKTFTGLDPKSRMFSDKDHPNYQIILSSQRRMDQFKAQFE